MPQSLESSLAFNLHLSHRRFKTKRMKRILFFLFLFATTGMMAQSSKVVSAYNSLKSGELDKAVEYIEPATEHKRSSTDAKTWVYRGQIYQSIAASDEDFEVDKKTALQTAVQSFEKAKELDSKERWIDQVTFGMQQLKGLAINSGISAYNDKSFEDSRDFFLMGADIEGVDGQIDTLAIYNAGLAAEQAEDYDVAITQYGKAAKLGYLGPNMYLYMANLYQNREMPEEYLSIVQEGRVAYPEDSDLIVYELNYYLQNGKFEEAERNLKLALEKEPDNKQLHFSLGVVYDNLERRDDAKKAYEDAIALDSNYFDPTFNLGAMYFNQGVEMNNAANDIQDNTKYNAARAEAKAVFETAQPFLEKAHQLEPNDLSAITSLAQLYALTGENDKYTEMKEKEKALTDE